MTQVTCESCHHSCLIYLHFNTTIPFCHELKESISNPYFSHIFLHLVCIMLLLYYCYHLAKKHIPFETFISLLPFYFVLRRNTTRLEIQFCVICIPLSKNITIILCKIYPSSNTGSKHAVSLHRCHITILRKNY